MPFRSHNAGCRGRRRAPGTGPRRRNHRLVALAALNVALRRRLDAVNMRLMRGHGASRAGLFARLDRPDLPPLPPDRDVFARPI